MPDVVSPGLSVLWRRVTWKERGADEVVDVCQLQTVV